MINLVDVKGIGPKTTEKFNKKEIYSIKDLVEFFPISYQTFSLNAEPVDQEKVAIKATIISNLSQYSPRRNLTVTNFSVQTNNAEYKIVAWNQKYLKFSFHQGDTVEILGKYDAKKNVITASKIQAITEEKLNAEVDVEIVPIYSKITGINNRKINTIINQALDNYASEINEVPILKEIHNPTSYSSLNQAQRIFKEIEFDLYYRQIMYLKTVDDRNDEYRIDYQENIIKDFINNLPYLLTSSQQTVIKEMGAVLKSDSRLKGLLLGDVGSGKTITSLTIALMVISIKKQVAFMAPTELLAQQIFSVIQREMPNVRAELLTGSTPKVAKRRIKSSLQVGAIDIVVGTHALVQDDVEFKELGLVIIDEQHRFGVEQRNKLINKGKNTNYLYLSATPIPRTLAQTLFGVVSVYRLAQKPSGRQEVKTEVITKSKRTMMMQIIEEELSNNHQVFFVCPLVEANEQLNLSDVHTVYEGLAKRYQDKYRLQMLYGPMKSYDKEIIMDDFKNENTDLLVTTTVIEVGIDIPKATVIVVLNAEHYGLATLHQLRGRVGRSDLQSYCFLYTNSTTKSSIDRLKLVEEYDDGEILAKKDLEYRGQGDFVGIKQSGNPDFKLFDLTEDLDIAEKVISKYEAK